MVLLDEIAKHFAHRWIGPDDSVENSDKKNETVYLYKFYFYQLLVWEYVKN